MIEETTSEAKALDELVQKTYAVLEPEKLFKELSELEKVSEEAGFWDDTEKAQKHMLQIKAIKNRVDPWKSLSEEAKSLFELCEMATAQPDPEIEKELEQTKTRLEEEYEKLRSLVFLGEERDHLEAFVTVHAGAGGTEACDWTSMLYRMYTRWCERRAFKSEIIDMQEAEGGLKSVSFSVQGAYSYGLLKGENGIHRLVRISPFDSNARRHTSFASVTISPALDDTINIDIKPEDIKVDVYRSSGAGGQHVNKTSSAVRMTHIATGIVVQCQNERSQFKNKDIALKVLKSRVYNYYKEKQLEERQSSAPEKKRIEWGSQIRSYVFQPYTLAKDARTAIENGNIQAVMDGDIDRFIEGYLEWLQK